MLKLIIILTILFLSGLSIYTVVARDTDIDNKYFKFKSDTDIWALYLFGLTVAVTDYPRAGAREIFGRHISIEL